MMQALLKAAFSYFTIVFAAAFMLGVLRVTVLAPQFGSLGAVMIEVPVVLGISWRVAGGLQRRWPFARAQRLMMGSIAFGLLMTAELVLAMTVFDQTLTDFAAGLTTLPGAAGLAGQIAFALIPAVRR